MVETLPKVELHLHLDGCIPVRSAWEMLGERGENLPPGIRSIQELRKKMVVDKPLKSQRELLAYFDIPTRVLQTREHLTRAYYELCGMKKEDNVCYCEVRFAPQLHTLGGLSLEEVMEAVLEGKRKGEEAFGIFTNLIVVGLKNRSQDENLDMLEAVKSYKNQGVVAVDCAGLEKEYSILEQEAFLQRARELGFFVTFHCGEVLESLPDFIEMTHRILPDRIAHGTTAIWSQELCEELVTHRIMLDICPTSNIQAGLYHSYQEIPIRNLERLGIPISISTDDTVLSDITLSQELERVSDAMKWTWDDIVLRNLQALDHSFVDDRTKEMIRGTINEYWKGDIL